MRDMPSHCLSFRYNKSGRSTTSSLSYTFKLLLSLGIDLIIVKHRTQDEPSPSVLQYAMIKSSKLPFSTCLPRFASKSEYEFQTPAKARYVTQTPGKAPNTSIRQHEFHKTSLRDCPSQLPHSNSHFHSVPV